MALDEAASQAAGTVKKSARKASGAVKKSARKAAETVQESAEKAATTTKGKARKAAATVQATRAARAGLVEDARRIAEDADLEEGAATQAIERVEAQHYDVVVNKRSLSVKALTATLNERWDNGWSLAHVFEQRGNTVLVFEKRA